MERKVLFHDGQDVGPDDFNNVQDFAQTSIDHVVGDAVTPKARYAGFTASKSGPTTITVAAGRLYSGGKVYARNDVYTNDFVTALPVAGKKIVSLVVWGTETDTNVQPREFLINEETRQTEARPVPLEHARLANINVVVGQEAPDPVPPLIDVGITEVARIVLSPLGVESITMLTDTALPQLENVEDRVEDLEGFRKDVEPRVSTIASDIAKLANSIKGLSNQGLVTRIAYDVARLKEVAGIPDERIDYASDHFLTLDETNTTDPTLLALVQEGIRFAPENEGLAQLQVFDPLNPRQVIAGGILLPAYDRTLRLATGQRSGELSIAQYSYQTHEMRELTMTRQRIRYGEELTVCTNNSWWQSGQYDPISGIFTKDGETFQVGTTFTSYDGTINHEILRLQRFWYDTVEEPYWDEVTVDHTVQGAQVAQTFLNSQDGWLDAIGLSFTRIAADGIVTLALTKTVRGEPDLDSVIAFVEVGRDKLRLAPEETVVALPPTYLQAGERYGIVVTTTADHWLAVTEGSNFAQGTLFYNTDGAYQQGDLTKDLVFSLYFAKFRSNFVRVDMQPLQLQGGITKIDILANTIAPKSTTITYEIQVGSSWYPLAAVEQTALIGLPPLLPLRIAFNGTTDMMPGVMLSGSQVKVSRPRTTFKHISKARTLPAPAQNIQVKERLEYFDPAYHTSSCKLRTGAGYATEVAATAVTELPIPEESAVERTYTFALPAAVPSYEIQTEGTTTTALKTFHVAERVDIALS
jgi:hypothetical protein